MGRLTVLATAFCAAFVLFLVAVAVVAGDDAAGGGADGGQGLPGVICSPAGSAPGTPVAGFANDQLANAAQIVAAGKEVGAPPRAQVIAVATAMQESGLRNVMHGDTAGPDSIGLFQQRTSWGPLSVRTDPKGSARLFYARLLAIPDWLSLPLTVAAQRVQASGLPDAYAKWEAKAEQVVGSVLGVVCQPSAPAPDQPGVSDPNIQLVVARAMAQVGTPYAWGGGNAAGPTRGISDHGGAADRAGDSRKIGFDCSGLMVYAFAAIGVAVPHQTQAIWTQFGPPITDRAQLQPGDMILLSGTGRPEGIDHVGLYLGDGRVVDAPESGTTVRVEPIWTNPYWSSHFVGAVRATARIAPRRA